MKLTKQETIQNHRAMWNWIANELESNRNTYEGFWELKEKYLDNNSFPDILNNCFCCDYVDSHSYNGWGLLSPCKSCPLIWGNEQEVKYTNCYCEGDSAEDYDGHRGPYGKCMDAFYEGDYKEAARLAREVANLPEKMEE